MSPEKLSKFSQAGYIAVNRMNNKDYTLRAKVRGDGGFLLTGVIVYQTTRIIGHTTVFVAAGTTIVGGFVTGGPAGGAAAYLGALATVPTAMATVETASLTIGTAASFIPGLP